MAPAGAVALLVAACVAAAGASPPTTAGPNAPAGAGVSRCAPGASHGLGAVPPVPGKQGFRAPPSRHGPPRRGRPFRTPVPGGAAAFRQGPDTVRVAAVLVDFDDQPMDSTRAYFERVLFHQNQYWNQVSHGQLVIVSTLSDSVYRMPQAMAYYGDDELFGERQTEFVRDALLEADDEFDYAAFDAYFCLHAGGGQEADVAGDSPEQLWSVFVPLEAMQFFLPDSTAANGILTNDVDANGDSFFIQLALVLPESESQDEDPQTRNPFSFGMLGVYAHEFGHVLGLPDLYDTTPADFPDSQGIGSFGVMGAGTWNFNGFVPAEPCVWARYELGFVDPVVITADTTLTLAAIEGEGEGPRAAIVLLGNDEFFLIENRWHDSNGNGQFDFHDADGDSIFTLYDLSVAHDSTDSYAGAEFDYFLPGEGAGSGLLIWHIDVSTLEAYGPLNAVEHDPEHKAVDLEEADEIEDLDTIATALENFGSADDAFRAGNATRFGPGTIPNTHTSYGAPTFITIDRISAADSLMTLSVRFGAGRQPPRRKPGWPTIALPAPVGANHPAVADLDGSPGLESVVVDSLGNVYVIDGFGGSPYPGGDPSAPIGNVGPDALTTPAVGDIDGDGDPDIVVVGRDGRVHVWDGATAAEVLDGDDDPATDGVWAVLDGAFEQAVPVLAPLGGPGLAVVIGSLADSTSGTADLYWLEQRQGRVEVRSAAVEGDANVPALFLPAAGDGIDIAGIIAVGVEDETSRFYFVNPFAEEGAAQELPRDRADRQHAVRSLVATNLTGGAAPIHIVASDDHGRIEAYRLAFGIADGAGRGAVPHRLRGLDGWPFELGLGVAHDLSLADIDLDGRVEIMVSAYDGRLYALNFNGTPQLGFPARVGDAIRPIPRLVPAPLVMQVAGDEAPEILAAAGDGRLLAVDARGSTLPDFLLPGPAGEGATPIIADIDADGRLDALVVADAGGRGVLSAYELPAAAGPVGAWPAYRGGPARAGILVGGGASDPRSQSFLGEFYVYPNPVTGDRASIHFSLGADARVRVEILDVTGRVVAAPRSGETAPGLTEHVVAWATAGQPSGVYVVRIEARSGQRQETRLYKFAVTH